jgi:hypothetical protein
MVKIKSIAAGGILACIIFAGIATYHVTEFEITGKAFSDVRGRGYPQSSISREKSPLKFSTAINTECLTGGIGLTLSLVSYGVYRCLDKKL